MEISSELKSEPSSVRNAGKNTRRTTKATGLISLAVLLSRVLGLLRDKVMGHFYGTGVLNDCFVIAFRIPNLLRDLFAEGALSQAFITVFSKKLKEEGEKSAWTLANRILSLVLVAMGIITLLGVAATPWIVDLMISSNKKGAALIQYRDHIILLTRVMYPFILLVSMAALVMGILNAKNVFGMPALSSCFFNLGCIIGGYFLGKWFDPSWGARSLIGMSIGVLIGGFLQLICQFPALWSLGMSFKWDSVWNDDGVKKILHLMIPATIASSATLVNVTVNTSFAASCAEGSVSALNYAFRLMQLPLGMFGVAVGTVTLPALSRACVGGKVGDEFRPTLTRGINMITVLVLPCTVGLSVLASPILAMIFYGGNFGVKSLSTSTLALQNYAFGLLAYSWLKVLTPAFYALDKRYIPMKLSFVAMGLNFFLNWLFVTKMNLGFQYLALTTSILATANFIILYIAMKKVSDGVNTKLIWNTLWKCSIAAFVMGEVCWLAANYIMPHPELFAAWQRWIIVPIMVGVAAFVYFMICYYLHVKEAKETFGIILRKIPGLRKFA